jgi:Fe-Mn family superoxide dismutase
MGAVVVVAARPQARQPMGVDHCHTLAGGTPILALDMYEHSYHIDFGAKAASYVDTFMDAIRWTNVERVFGQMTGDRGMAGEQG